MLVQSEQTVKQVKELVSTSDAYAKDGLGYVHADSDANKRFLQYAVMPWLTIIGSAFKSSL